MAYGEQLVDEAMEGWAWPLRWRRAHYVNRGRSLCGRESFEGVPDRLKRHPLDECRPCRRRLSRLLYWRRESADAA